MDKQYNNVLHQLCNYNYIGFVTYLLDHDPLALALCSDINISAQTPLQVAIANKFYSLAKVMIEKNVPLHPPADKFNQAACIKQAAVIFCSHILPIYVNVSSAEIV